MFKTGNITLISFELHDKFLIFFRVAVGKGGVKDLIQFYRIQYKRG